MSDAIEFATGPVSWGVDFADAPTNPPYQLVLDEIVESGIRALELGPVGYLPEHSASLRAELGDRGLTAVGSFVFEDLHEPAQAEAIKDVARRACRAIAAAEGSVLVIIDRPGAERIPTAGQSDRATRLDESQWQAMMRTTEAVATIAEDHGLRPAFHPHAGGYVEFEDEIERLLASTSLDLCLDTGHLAYAGIRADEALVTYGSRLTHLHLKDIRGSVIARVREEGLGFWDALAAEIFCPLGTGVVDCTACLQALKACGYAGFATIEQDRLPGGAPVDDLRISLRVMREAQGRIATQQRRQH